VANTVRFLLNAAASAFYIPQAGVLQMLVAKDALLTSSEVNETKAVLRNTARIKDPLEKRIVEDTFKAKEPYIKTNFKVKGH
jgi:hypothetical protein